MPMRAREVATAIQALLARLSAAKRARKQRDQESSDGYIQDSIVEESDEPIALK